MALLVTHSIMKFSSTYLRQSGCAQDNINVQGRWKRSKQIVDIYYIDPDIPYPSAKAAVAICIGGPIKYVLKKEKLDDCWIVEHVVPHIFKIYKDKKAVGTLREGQCCGPVLMHKTWSLFRSSIGWSLHTTGFRIS